MRILITGANGFMGQNLIARLRQIKGLELDEFDRDKDLSVLEQYCREADFIYHLAGVNRPRKDTEFLEGNVDLTRHLLDYLRKYKNYCPVLYSSSIQAATTTPYGLSKRAAEQLLRQYSKETGAITYIYRLPNVFGKWCKPNYNSVIATFCYNMAHNLPITIHDPTVILQLVYIDDVVEDFILALKGEVKQTGDYCINRITYEISLKEVAELIMSFRRCKEHLTVPDMKDSFTKKLYSTYLSYLPKEDLCYGLIKRADERGFFTEFIKHTGLGQISVNVSKPGIIKGNHYHDTKVEKFLVVSGEGLIRLRKIRSQEVYEYYVSSKKPQVVEIPPGYAHQIVNVGSTDLVTIIWANESFDEQHPDTYFMEV